ncbi:MAG: Gfo/Idh/MocA family oxidoreductase [Clostridia bacterium]|nr:Gfo/Idh/MocA family oxidoreductase [Clostridia bacterium]
MSKKIYSVAILGCGARGAETYGQLMFEKPDAYKIQAICDISEAKLEKYGERFAVPEADRFSELDVFFEKKRADLIVIATLDGEHVEPCIRALSLGYDVLLEKPITEKREECEALLEAQKKYGGKVLVCHVLRYAPAFLHVAKLIDEGTIGKLVSISATENVAFWHQAHSFVRGNWRNRKVAAPMILAKCCHDLDLLQFYAKSRCESISSVGALTFFKEENAPEGAAARCLDCKYVDDCAYSAKRIYIDNWRVYKPANLWPHNVVTPVVPVTEEALTEGLRTGPYGRCVFRCDNDVVDHQTAQMTFENGVTATLTMMPLTAYGGRILKFYGTYGEIVLDEEEGFIDVKKFSIPKERIKIGDLAAGGYSHGGGDYYLIETLTEVLAGEKKSETSLENSIESHLMGICAEESRLKGGELIYLRDKR